LSEHGPAHYGLDEKKKSTRLVEKSWDVPAKYEFGGETVTPLRLVLEVETEASLWNQDYSVLWRIKSIFTTAKPGEESITPSGLLSLR